MFANFGVNSLSAFKAEFSVYPLDPRIKDVDHSRPVWASQSQGTQKFIGQVVVGTRHGMGVLLDRGSATPIVYIGSFEGGLRNGYGMIMTSRGETFHGFFKDDLMWGPGAYTFPISGSVHEGRGTPNRHRVRFDGMHNGRPLGKGRMVWSDGVCEHGEFDGMEMVRSMPAQDCSGVLLVAESNSEMAKRVVAELEMELKRQGMWDGKAAGLIAEATPRRGASRV